MTSGPPRPYSVANHTHDVRGEVIAGPAGQGLEDDPSERFARLASRRFADYAYLKRVNGGEMASKAKVTEIHIDGDKAMAGVLALLVAEREERLADKGDPRKTEVILADAGLEYTEIAAVTGKNYDAVKQSVRRGRRKK